MFCHVFFIVFWYSPDSLQHPKNSPPQTPSKRFENRKFLREQISEWTRVHDKKEAMRLLAESGVPVSAVMDSVDVYTDPNLIERGFIQNVETDSGEIVRMPGCPARLSKSQVPLRAAAPLGAHTREVLMNDLELDDDSFNELAGSGALG